MKSIKKILYLLLVLGTGLLVINFDSNSLYLNLKMIDGKLLILALFLQVLTMVLIGFQWYSLARLLDPKIAYKDIFIMNCKGNIIDAITPGAKVGGELARVYDIRNKLGLNLKDSILLVGLQKTISIISLLLLSVLSLVWFTSRLGVGYGQYRRLFLFSILIISGVLVLGLYLIVRPENLYRLLSFLRVREGRIRSLQGFLDFYRIHILRLISNRRILILEMLLGILIWGLFSFKLQLVVRGFNIEMDFLTLTGITYLGYIIGMVPLLPGSIGSFESGMVGIFAIKGIGVSKGLAIAVVFRFVTFWFEFIVSLAVVGLNHLFLYMKKDDIYMERLKQVRERKLEEFYIIPTAITYMNMLFGILAIFISLIGGLRQIKSAGLLILFAAFTDKLDGYVARKFNMTSDFGRELDSLCDLVSFGLAPIIVGWRFGMGRMGSSAVLAGMIFIGTGIFRLARFNVEDSGDYIVGLPITVAGGVLAMKYVVDITYRMGNVYSMVLLRENLMLISLLSLLMIGRFKIKKPEIIDKDLF